jgi:hypothetical protein
MAWLTVLERWFPDDSSVFNENIDFISGELKWITANNKHLIEDMRIR